MGVAVGGLLYFDDEHGSPESRVTLTLSTMIMASRGVVNT